MNGYRYKYKQGEHVSFINPDTGRVYNGVVKFTPNIETGKGRYIITVVAPQDFSVSESDIRYAE